MHFTKPVIDLIFDIRRIAPLEVRPKIKLSNPKLLVLLIEIYKQYDQASLQLRIKQLITVAEPTLMTMISDQEQQPTKRMYRGQPIAQSEGERSSVVQNHPGKRTPIIYRGQKLAV